MFSLLCRLVYLFFLFVPIWTATYRRMESSLNMNSMINVEKSRTKLIFVCLCVCSCLSVSLFLSRYIYACIWHCLCPQSPPRPFAPLTLADSFVCICAPCVYWAVVYFFFLLFFNSSSAAVTQKPWLRNGISKYFPHTHTQNFDISQWCARVCHRTLQPSISPYLIWYERVHFVCLVSALA